MFSAFLLFIDNLNTSYKIIPVRDDRILCVALHRWTKVHELLIEQRIRKDMLAQAVRESSTMLRSEANSILLPY